MSDIHVTWDGRRFTPCTEHDKELSSGYEVGSTIKIKPQKPRNPAHHRKAFALLNLGFDYWEPTGFITEAERQLASRIADQLYTLSGGQQVVVEWVTEITRQHEQKRMESCGAAEKSFNAYRKDITIRAGFYDVIKTPNGIRKEAHSLAFSSMSQEKFSAWYKEAFNIIWNMTLYRVFDHEKEAEQAVEKMMGFI